VRKQIVLFLCGIVVIAAMLGLAAGCGSAKSDSQFNDTTSNEGGASGPGLGGQTGDGGCAGFGCEKVACSAGGTTTISGQVFDPAGKNPLYDVAVYVPSQMPLPALATGVTCDHCGATLMNPAASTLTDENGKFTLTNVPVDAHTPVVIQVGKWRRTFTLNVQPCTDNPMPTPLTLPKNASEGDMPQVAVAVNILDSLECLLSGMGVDSAEFVNGAGGSGHVHMFPADQNSTLWASEVTLKPYDIVLLDCEGGESPLDKSAAMLQGMHDYAGEGGRVFATHYHYLWFKGTSPGTSPAISGLPDFVDTAAWKPGVSSWATGSQSFSVDQSFPKGVSFAKWLVNVGASTTAGSIQLDDFADSVDSVNSPPSTRWIYDGSNVEYMSFNTPTTAADAAQCGRVVFSDLHVSGLGVSSLSDCKFDKSGNLTAQQKALEFLFCDLSACVQSDSVQPTPPR
jgi:hypothetical protein